MTSQAQANSVPSAAQPRGSGWENPQVAVVMTVFNGLPYLKTAVDSILDQTYEAFDFIIVNDGSNDGTKEYLDSLNDPRVQVIHQDRQGQQAAAHRAIVATKAPYIARMDSDDIAHPNRLERQVDFLDSRSDVGLVGSQIKRTGESHSGLLSHFPTEHDQIVDDLMHNRHSMCNPSTMFRRELYFAVGGYWKHNIAEDWDLFLRIADVAKLANISEPLLTYRFHTGSINGRRTAEAQLYNEYAAHLASLRRQGAGPVSFSEFLAKHRSRRFPQAFFFYLDCFSLAQYRLAVAELHSKQPLKGATRAVFAILCSPGRFVRRMTNYLAST